MVGIHNNLSCRTDGLIACQSAERKFAGAFHFSEHETAVERADAVEVAEDAQQEILIGLHVACVDLQQEIVIAGNVIALGDFRNVFHCVHDAQGVFLSMLFHFKIAECHEATVDLLGVEHGDIAFDVTLAFKALDAFECRGGREVYCGGEFLVGETSVVLQTVEDMEVDGI